LKHSVYSPNYADVPLRICSLQSPSKFRNSN